MTLPVARGSDPALTAAILRQELTALATLLTAP
jgi:hypothetical protein